MKYIAHRINTKEMLENIPEEYGVELDLRDYQENLILEHDPFKLGESFSQYLDAYNHDTMILNIKSERIEHKILELLKEKGTVKDYFFLDSSYPMIRELIRLGEHKIAVRYSEYEPIEYAMSLAKQVDWVWVDCFNDLPLDDESYNRLKEHFKICIVSPELQKHSLDLIESFVQKIGDFEIDAVCTKRPDLWEKHLNVS